MFTGEGVLFRNPICSSVCLYKITFKASMWKPRTKVFFFQKKISNRYFFKLELLPVQITK